MLGVGLFFGVEALGERSIKVVFPPQNIASVTSLEGKNNMTSTFSSLSQSAHCIIRSATLEDMPAIEALIHLKAEFDHYSEPLNLNLEQLQQDLFGETPLAFVLLAEVGQEIVGFATYHRIYSTFLAKPGLWLDDLYLKPPFRGQGIGKKLMQSLCQTASEMGCGRIDWTVSVGNLDGIQFYQKIGADIFETLQLCRLDEATIHRMKSVH